MMVHRAAFVVAAALALATPRPAAAQAPEAPSESLSLGEEGLRRFQGAHWREAYDLFRRANDTTHAPTLVLYMAHCQERLGDLGAAYRLYHAVTRERLAEDAPLQFRTAQRVAAQELHRLEQRVAPFQLAITGVPEEQVRVRVDGVEVPAAQIPDLALEPGDHVVEASIPGGASHRGTVRAAAGHPVGLTLVFDAVPPAPVTAPAPAPAPAPVPPAPDRPPYLQGAAIAFGAAGVSLTAGLITGVVSLRAASDIKSRCSPGGHCLIADQGAAASAGQLADASTGTLVVGALAVAAGVVLAVAHVRTPERPGATGVRLLPGRAFLAGVF